MNARLGAIWGRLPEKLELVCIGLIQIFFILNLPESSTILQGRLSQNPVNASQGRAGCGLESLLS